MQIIFLRVPRAQYSHGQDGCHHVQGSDEDAQLCDECCQEQCPCRLAIRLPMSEHLPEPCQKDQHRRSWTSEPPLRFRPRGPPTSSALSSPGFFAFSLHVVLRTELRASNARAEP